jgi:hypothetical protein
VAGGIVDKVRSVNSDSVSKGIGKDLERTGEQIQGRAEEIAEMPGNLVKRTRDVFDAVREGLSGAEKQPDVVEQFGENAEGMGPLAAPAVHEKLDPKSLDASK